jgi:signal peptidase I
MLSSWPLSLALLASLALIRTILARVHPSSPARREQLQSARDTLDSLSLTLFTLFFVIQPFVAQAYVIPTGSMERTLPVGTRILASPLAPRLVPVHAGDVLVFRPPHLAIAISGGPDDEVWIKRCIGAPGQRIEIKKNVLWRDGKMVAEPYAIWKSPGLAPLVYDLKIIGGAVYSRSYDNFGRADLWSQAGVVVPDQNEISRLPSGVVPPDQFLMLGDHRNDSLDGHVWGFLARPRIVGRAFVSFWPPRQIGPINR